MTLERFHQTLPDGYSLTLPRFEDIPIGLIRRTRHATPTDQVFTLLEALAPADAWEHLDQLNRGAFDTLMKAWKDDSETDLGESTASAIS